MPSLADARAQEASQQSNLDAHVAHRVRPVRRHRPRLRRDALRPGHRVRPDRGLERRRAVPRRRRVGGFGRHRVDRLAALEGGPPGGELSRRRTSRRRSARRRAPRCPTSRTTSHCRRAARSPRTWSNKNVTWLLGYAHGHDVAGRTRDAVLGLLARHRPQRVQRDPHARARPDDHRDAFIGDVVLENGDQSKPYRYIPLFAPGTTSRAERPIDLVNALRVSARPLEQLPLSRQRYAL